MKIKVYYHLAKFASVGEKFRYCKFIVKYSEFDIISYYLAKGNKRLGSKRTWNISTSVTTSSHLDPKFYKGLDYFEISKEELIQWTKLVKINLMGKENRERFKKIKEKEI